MSLNKSHVFKTLVMYYHMTGALMGPVEFENTFAGRVTTEEALAGLYEFNDFLDKSRGTMLS